MQSSFFNLVQIGRVSPHGIYGVKPDTLLHKEWGVYGGKPGTSQHEAFEEHMVAQGQTPVAM